MPSRVWARKGTRRRIVRDYRCGHTCLFSAACRRAAAAVGHGCAMANDQEMNRHLREIGERVSSGKHALFVLDRAGWHGSRKLAIRASASLLRLPPRSAALNPVETLFSVLKHRRFANRVFENVEHAREAVVKVWNGFTRKTAESLQVTARAWTVP